MQLHHLFPMQTLLLNGHQFLRVSAMVKQLFQMERENHPLVYFL